MCTLTVDLAFWRRVFAKEVCRFPSRPPFHVGERGVEAAPEPDHDGELRPAREGGHHVSRGQAAAGRTRTALSPSRPSVWAACFTTSPCPHSSSAAAATTRATGRRVASSRRVKRQAGRSPTAAVKPSPPCAAGGTTPPTSTRWRSVPHPRTLPALALMSACCDVAVASAGRLHLQAGAVSGRSPPGYRSGGDRRGLPAGKSDKSEKFSFSFFRLMVLLVLWVYVRGSALVS